MPVLSQFAEECEVCPLADFAPGRMNVDAVLESTDRPTVTELGVLSQFMLLDTTQVDDFFNGGSGIRQREGVILGMGNLTAHCNVQEECGTAVWM